MSLWKGALNILTKAFLSVVNPNGGIDVNIQDQTTPTVIIPFNQVHDSTTLAAEALINQREIVVSSSTGIVVGSLVILFSTVTEKYYFGKVTSISGSPTIILDSPLDSTFPIGTSVDIAIHDLNVDGSSIPQAFGLRGIGAPTGLDLSVDITRIIFTCIADAPVTLSKFGDLTALINGLVLRKRNGINSNIFNVKNNRDIMSLAFDFNVSLATNPAQGENGFVSRLTFAGQSKMGVVVRLPIGDDLEMIVQDDLRDLISLVIMAEGHVVD